MPRITQEKTDEALRMIVAGATTKEVSQALDISVSSVSHIRRANSENIPSIKAAAGRPKKAPGLIFEYLRPKYRQGAFKRAFAVTPNDLVTKTPYGRRLPTTTAQAKRKKSKETVAVPEAPPAWPVPDTHNVQGRLRFVDKYKDWTEEDWKKVIWSGRTKIGEGCGGEPTVVWVDIRRNPHRLDEGSVAYGGWEVQVWGCFSWNGPGNITQIDEDQTRSTERYVQILKEDLEASIENWGVARDGLVFHHRSGPVPHKTKKTIDTLRAAHFSEAEGTLLLGPTHSLDLDPMVQIWDYVRKRLWKYRKAPEDQEELWERIVAVWRSIPVKVCQDLIRSMPSRVEAVREAKGMQVKQQQRD